MKHVDLIAKVHGLEKAEAYIETIPDSCRGILAYQALLANYARYSRVKKAEELFQKMRDLGFPVTVFSCDQLLVLYKRHDKKKIADVLLLMEKENVKPSLTTYKHLMDLRCKSGDTKGTEEIFETMQSEGIEPDTQARFIMARCYAFAGIKDKAEALLKEIEGSNLEENRRVCRSLLLLYGLLGKADEVERIWKVCETDPHFLEGMAAITAWGKLKKVEAAEAVFDRLLRTRTLRSNVCYSALLKVYADNKLLAKSENLVKRMSKDGFRTGPLDWNSLVRLYLEAGEVEKADFTFMKLAQRNSRKPPLLSTYVAIMRQYAKRGDIHNSEKMFYRIKKAGYTIELCQFEHLVEAYINANKPAYGIWERMKAENIFPSQIFIRRLHQLDPFRTTAASYLLG